MRIHPSPAFARNTRFGIVVSVAALALFGSCNEPQAPNPAGDGAIHGSYSPTGSTLEFRLESPAGGVSPLQLLASDLTYDAATQELHAQVALRNSGSEPLPGPDGVLVGGFDPAAVTPRNAQGLACPACPDCPCPWPWRFEHRGTYGDGILSPGETSTPVEWIIFDPAGESFAFRALLVEAAAAPGGISGHVFADANANGHRDLGETGIANASLTLVHGDVATGTQTDETGGYSFQVSEPGLYEVVRAETNACQPTSPPRQQIIILRRADGSLTGFDHADFGCSSDSPGDSTTVTGIVFNDENRNGVHEDSETGVAGVLITANMLFCPSFAAIETHTDEHGLYRIQLACRPPYMIAHAPVPGTVDTSPNPVFVPLRRNGTEPTLPPEPPATVLHVNFGVARAVVGQEVFIDGYVFRDVNQNGVRDGGEPGVADVGINASGLLCLTPIAVITRTDADGHYRVKGADVHCPLPWQVGHEPRLRLCDTSQNPIELYAPAPPDGVFHQDFGVTACNDSVPPAGFTIEGFVFFDLNQNGVHDRVEAGVPNALLYLASPCDVLLQARTDPNGHYVFGPEMTANCPFDGVVQGEPVFPHHTTPNPFPIDPHTVPPGGVVEADFGVLPLPPPR